MNILANIAQRLAIKLNKRRFHQALLQMDATPVLKCGDWPVTILSQVHQRDVWPYLLAIKSMGRFKHPAKVVVVCDPSFGEAEKAIVARHIDGVEFRAAAECQDPELPTGGTWERLTCIADLVSQGHYVIQLDADTVALATPTDVQAAVAANESFMLSTEDGQSVEPCLVTANWAVGQAGPDAHIQVHCEAAMAKLPRAEALRYMRGCSGFAGFAPHSFGRAELRALSRQMQAMLGGRWREWGTEQFSSNFVLANSPQVRALPHPRYCHPGRATPESVFLHFIGYVRFSSDRYAREALRVIADIRTRALV